VRGNKPRQAKVCQDMPAEQALRLSDWIADENRMNANEMSQTIFLPDRN
jgi:hypothetical protein